MSCTTSSARPSAGSRSSEDHADDIIVEQRTTDLILGAVAYDQKVVPIWDGFQQYFRTPRAGLRLRPLLELRAAGRSAPPRTHSRRVELSAGVAADRALAARLGRRAEAICMRDTDRDLRSVVLVRSDGGIETIADLRGKIVAVGARDSPQATLIPLNYLADQGLAAGPGLPGAACSTCWSASTAITSAASATPCARCSAARRTRPASSTRTTWRLLERRAFRHGSTRVLAQTAAYDHCNFTVLDDVAAGAVDPLSRAAAGDVVRRRRGAAAARSRRAEGVGARPRDAATRSSLRRSTGSAPSTRSSTGCRGAMQVDLGTLGFAEGGYLLVKRAVRRLRRGRRSA